MSAENNKSGASKERKGLSRALKLFYGCGRLRIYSHEQCGELFLQCLSDQSGGISPWLW